MSESKEKSAKERVDKALVECGLAPTRSQAQLLIEEGVVFFQGNVVTKSSEQVTSEHLEVRKEVQYVSRGGHKLEGAMSRFEINLQNLVAADVGASTGGFSDFLLKNGVKKIYCLDVGHDQLSPLLKTDPRVTNFEGVNMKHPFTLPEKVDIAVVDLSFISIKLVLKNVFELVRPGGMILSLIKPQFEVGPTLLDKNGVVKSEGHRLVMLHELKEWCAKEKFKLLGQCESPILGKGGNKEYFFYFIKE